MSSTSQACDSTGTQCQNTVNAGTSGDAWTYDSTGNRSQVGTSDGYGNGNRITSFGSVNFTYDSVGAIVCRIVGTCPGGTGSGLKYGWDALGRLRVVKDGYSGAVVDSFFYDPQGRRVRKKKATGGSEYYVYEGSQVILDVDSTGAVLREYAWFPGTVDRLLALRTPTDTFAAVLDPGNGSVRGLARFRTGARVKEYAELPWGDVAADTGLVVRYRFAGREYDQETGLYYMRARYYDPVLGRWISEDPIGVAGGLNLYRFASNDPVNRRDPWGLSDPVGCLDSPQGCPLPTIEVWGCPHGLRLMVGNTCDDPFGVGAAWGLPFQDFGGGSGTPGFGGYAYQPDRGSNPSEGTQEKNCAAIAAAAALRAALDLVGAGLLKKATKLGKLAHSAAVKGAYAGRHGRREAALGLNVLAQVHRGEQGSYSSARLFGSSASSVIGVALTGYGALDAAKDLAGLVPTYGALVTAVIGLGETVACYRDQ